MGEGKVGFFFFFPLFLDASVSTSCYIGVGPLAAATPSLLGGSPDSELLQGVRCS